MMPRPSSNIFYSKWQQRCNTPAFRVMQGLYEDSIRYYVRAVAMNPKADNAWQYLRISLRYVLLIIYEIFEVPWRILEIHLFQKNINCRSLLSTQETLQPVDIPI